MKALLLLFCACVLALAPSEAANTKNGIEQGAIPSAVFNEAGEEGGVTEEGVTEFPTAKAKRKKNNSTLVHLTTQEDSIRVYPGTTAALGQFPFVVAVKTTLSDESVRNCGGALVADNYVLTTASCVVLAATITVTGGALDPQDRESGQTVNGVQTIHPGFRRTCMVHNIALVKLLTPFLLGVNVYPIKLSKGGGPAVLDYQELRVYGWGLEGEDLSAELLYETMTQVPKAACESRTADIFVEYAPTTACISSSASTNGFCKGDIGGPVTYTYTNDPSLSLVGVMSELQACPSRYPMAYTRIQPHLAWIRSIVKQA